MSRVHNIETWYKRIMRLAPVTNVAMETVRFDTQLMDNPDIQGVEYQQGELQGYEVREYLLEKFGRKCVYCGAKDVPLEIEHITPKSRGGSNRVSNLTLACRPCNQKKGNKTADEFGHPNVQKLAKAPLKDASAVNATRWEIYRTLQNLGLPVEIGTGGRTKYNRSKQNYPKTHWIDAVCVGKSGERVIIHPAHRPLLIAALGRQSRQMCQNDANGFRRRKKDGTFESSKGKRIQFGFQAGDIVRATQSAKNRTFIGKLNVSSRGDFKIFPLGTKERYGVMYKNCTHLHRADGYSYAIGAPATFPKS
jgi:5-methylcytosine-specific restriction endonuclease McrA